jgi:hypothetical protein
MRLFSSLAQVKSATVVGLWLSRKAREEHSSISIYVDVYVGGYVDEDEREAKKRKAGIYWGEDTRSVAQRKLVYIAGSVAVSNWQRQR